MPASVPTRVASATHRARSGRSEAVPANHPTAAWYEAAAIAPVIAPASAAARGVTEVAPIAMVPITQRIAAAAG